MNYTYIIYNIKASNLSIKYYFSAAGRGMPSFSQRSVILFIRAAVSGCDENIFEI